MEPEGSYSSIILDLKCVTTINIFTANIVCIWVVQVALIIGTVSKPDSEARIVYSSKWNTYQHNTIMSPRNQQSLLHEWLNSICELPPSSKFLLDNYINHTSFRK
jgi:hypothetical protein